MKVTIALMLAGLLPLMASCPQDSLRGQGPEREPFNAPEPDEEGGGGGYSPPG